MPGMSEPGPSSHPRGPPNLGQLSTVAMQATPVNVQQPQPPQQPGRSDEGTPGSQIQNVTNPNSVDTAGQTAATQSQPANPSTGGRRAARQQLGSDEWTRLRKDNHVGILFHH